MYSRCLVNVAVYVCMHAGDERKVTITDYDLQGSPLQNRRMPLSSSPSLPSILYSNENETKDLSTYDRFTAVNQSGSCASGGTQLDTAGTDYTHQGQGSHYSAGPSSMTPHMSDKQQGMTDTLFPSKSSVAGLHEHETYTRETIKSQTSTGMARPAVQCV